ncbi:hypothetical protein [Streptomyces noursei]|uniref:hypothetical protein n=1 Tax=Streptomyces noursei TaxID=1971 RepID=UPI00167ADEB0|nr:hypothetical protein [Streptomyces noursei]MCZ1013983.1 hypothetical protein [Streptomyces noursei]GGX40412.1 hypothetical protein GCM10010341_72890 [Streptomyces noursei]
MTSSTPMSAADVAAHEKASHVRLSPEVQRAVTRFEVAALRVEELTALDAREMSGAQFDSLTLAQDAVAESRRVLELAGLLHLVDGSVLVSKAVAR